VAEYPAKLTFTPRSLCVVEFPDHTRRRGVSIKGGVGLKGYRRYFLKKLGWFAITLVFAFVLNFILPRLMPGDPVAAIVSRQAQTMSNSSGVEAIYRQYTELFGTNKPMLTQFFIYVKNVLHGDFGFSFSQYPRTVAAVLGASLWWTLILQLPAIIVGWTLGNILGAMAAYLKGGFDKALLPRCAFSQQFSALWHGDHLAGSICGEVKMVPDLGGIRL
jgi:peptide/nickel transport system permease protein